jgi:predicted aconitase with swiveling domain
VRERILKGHRVCKGKAEGEALVSQMRIGFLGLINPETGVIQDKGHDLEGMSVAGKILVFPMGKGSAANTYTMLELVRCKTQPKGIINLQAVNPIAVGAVMGNIPMIDKLDGNPLELIKTGDYVELDADKGIVKIRSRD